MNKVQIGKLYRILSEISDIKYEVEEEGLKGWKRDYRTLESFEGIMYDTIQKLEMRMAERQ